MFGTLYKVKSPKWYKDEENQIITFDLVNHSYSWKVFSIYVVPLTTDYLRVEFNDDNDYLDFLSKITKRSIYQFNTPVSSDDKILTLSTCQGTGDKRLVVHAVQIKND